MDHNLLYILLYAAVAHSCSMRRTHCRNCRPFLLTVPSGGSCSGMPGMPDSASSCSTQQAAAAAAAAECKQSIGLQHLCNNVMLTRKICQPLNTAAAHTPMAEGLLLWALLQHSRQSWTTGIWRAQRNRCSKHHQLQQWDCVCLSLCLSVSNPVPPLSPCVAFSSSVFEPSR